ncbi:MAG: hypothetical protein ABNH53_01950 [Henriciella sp.]|jgi:hypothetical protein
MASVVVSPNTLEYAFETGVSQPNAGEIEWTSKEGVTRKLCRQIRGAQSIFCEDCNVSHKAWILPSGDYEVVCEAGVRVFPKHELERWKLKQDELIELLRNNLPLSGDEDVRCADTFWYLGDYTFRHATTPVWLARKSGCPETLAKTIQSLRSRSPAQAGVIIVSSSISEKLLWPRDSKAVRLKDLLVVSNYHVSIDRHLVNTAMPANSHTLQQVGRPTKSEVDYAAEFVKRAQSGSASRKGVGNEALALREEILNRYGADFTCASSTIESKIRAHYKAWKDARYSAEKAFPHNSELHG